MMRGVSTTEDEGVKNMDEMTFQEKMNQILDRIRDLPAVERATTESTDATAVRRTQVQQSVGELQEALDYLRLSVKYLVFDLEATRRENAYLRRMLEASAREHEKRQRGDDERPDSRDQWE